MLPKALNTVFKFRRPVVLSCNYASKHSTQLSLYLLMQHVSTFKNHLAKVLVIEHDNDTYRFFME